MDALAKECERVRKKQRVVYEQDNERLSFLIAQLEQAQSRLGAGTAPGAEVCVGEVFKDAAGECKKNNVQQTSADHKDLQTGLTKLGKVVDKALPSNLGLAYAKLKQPFPPGPVKEVIAHHLMRQGRFDELEMLVKEGGAKAPSREHQTTFRALFKVQQAMDDGNFDPVLQWCDERKAALGEQGADLAFQVHRLRFLRLLAGPTPPADLVHYVRTHFAQHGAKHAPVVCQLSCAILWSGERLARSPYKHLQVGPTHHHDLRVLFAQTACTALGFAMESPVAQCVGAGVLALPKLLKLTAVMQDAPNVAKDKTDLLVLGLDLPNHLTHHSVFVCPVSHEQASPQNPPVLLRCGHMLCRQSMFKLARGHARFKCPYCPTEQTISQSLALHL